MCYYHVQRNPFSCEEVDASRARALERAGEKITNSYAQAIYWACN